jgi:shikimate kinase
MKIFLIGLPGSGKTTIAKQLAKQLPLPYMDLDQEIEKAEMKPISQIFKEKKEDYFRKIESQLLKDWCASDFDFVMATGGGAPCFFDNMKHMNEAGVTIFLDVPTMEIARRVANSKGEERPLLKSNGIDGLKDQIEFLRSNRINVYKQAQKIFTGERITATEIAKDLGF